MIMGNAIHHFHKRKRIHKKHEKYPHPHAVKRWVDRFVYVVGIVGPIMSIPQVMKIWVGQDAAAISLGSYTTYFALNFFWIWYGYLHNEKPIIFMYIGWAVINFSIILGALLYG